MVIAWTKQAGAKGDFRHEFQMGHAIATLHDCSLCASTANAPKKRCGLWLTFLLHDLADLVYDLI